jgi:glycogen debranching enzyme
MVERPPVQEQYAILAPSPRSDDRTRVLKHGESFAVFDHLGNIEQTGLGEQGLYHEGTRYLSRFRVLVEGAPPLLLSSTVRNDNSLLIVDLTNPDFSVSNSVRLPKDTLHLGLHAFLHSGRCYCRFRLHNFGLEDLDLSWTLLFEADYADIFEVRGMRRERRGELLTPEVDGNIVRLRYRGLDRVVRETELLFEPQPGCLYANGARFDVRLPTKGDATFDVTISCSPSAKEPRVRFNEALDGASRELKSASEQVAQLYTSNEQFNDWLNRSAADLHMMVTRTPHGPYPYAGVPWFSTAFGRDGIITALECLWLAPQLARGVLQFLAATQATELDPASDAQPGKVLHETRQGEMAELGEIPFRRYYGTADATPLFIILAQAYYRRTGDRQFISELWPNIEAALRWIDEYADMDGDGFFEYARQSETGLVTQGWKDSVDSVFHADGRLAPPPIALCEIQGYVYAAWRSAAEIARVLGRAEDVTTLKHRSKQLQRAFEEVFWCDDLGTYALALDGQKQPCRVRTSNAGHLLLTGIARAQRARKVADLLLSEQMFSGWGIRTVGVHEARYNPMAYHNGSVWPHDNALIAAGMARYGFQEEALKILTGLFDASLGVDLHRMPELFCGFTRTVHESPTLYPVACAPQAWAAGAVFMLLQSSIGLSIDATRQKLSFTRPMLPEFLHRVLISNLKVGDGCVDLILERHPRDVGVHVARREGDVEISTIK